MSTPFVGVAELECRGAVSHGMVVLARAVSHSFGWVVSGLSHGMGLPGRPHHLAVDFAGASDSRESKIEGTCLL